MTMSYKPEFIERIGTIRTEFTRLHHTDPSQATNYLRAHIRDMPSLDYPEPLTWLLASLRVATNVPPEIGYSSGQMQTLSDALGLCGRYEQLTNEDVFLAVEKIEVAGIGVHLSFGEEEGQAFLDTLETP
ncbi:MAG: hypothetical protein HY365_01635 [Candidatus Aenigmarchaeota archaeon]|nr:hypothetical protein [Candidatus Aenigmarchaeota archaeon]